MTPLQHHLRNKTLPLCTIIEALNLERTTLHKWRSGELYPHRLNAEKLIKLFTRNGVAMDYNDIYQLRPMDNEQ